MKKVRCATKVLSDDLYSNLKNDSKRLVLHFELPSMLVAAKMSHFRYVFEIFLHCHTMQITKALVVTSFIIA